MQADVLGIHIDTLTMDGTLDRVRQFIADGSVRRIVTANPEMIYASQFDDKLKHLINSADIVTPDGEGVVWAARLLGFPIQERVTGIDLLLAILPIAAQSGWRLFFLGGAPGVAHTAAKRVMEQHPGLKVKHHHGYFSGIEEEGQVIEQIKSFKPHLLFVGLGAPRQEFWIAEHCSELAVPVSVGVGGSFDVLSGGVKRAPVLAQKLKLEWLVRLIRQPRRIKRQLVLPKFVFRVLRQKIF